MASSAVRLPGARDTALLGVAVAAVSTSAPIIAACAAPALAIALWRCLLGALATLPFTAHRLPRQYASLTGRQRWEVVAAGALLAAHFATWIPSLRFTSVASATALVATQPVWAALIARAMGAKVSRGVWIGIAISLAGALALTGIDASLDPAALLGDALALAGGALAAAYVTVGERSRQSLSTGTYTVVIYAIAAAGLLPLCVGLGVDLAGFDRSDWVLIVALTLIAQLLGHSLINHVLHHTSATVVSLAILFEMPGAVIVAALWLGQAPPLEVVPALLLLACGLVVVVRSADLREPTESPPV